MREPVFQQETLGWADIDRDEHWLATAYLDCLGRYARFDLRSLTIREARMATGPKPLGRPAAQRELGRELGEIADRHEVDLRQLEARIERLAAREGT